MRVRRSNEERSAQTRSRILEATIDCLADLGYAKTTTTEIADRAGVSRGAQLHHYPTKAALVSAAMEHLFDEREREFRRAITSIPPGPGRAEKAVDLLWSIVGGRNFYAWLELVVAARTDEELRSAMQSFSARTSQSIQRTWIELFPPPATPNPVHTIAPYFAFSLMHGIALDQLVINDHSRWPEMLEMLKKLAPLVVPGGTP